LSIICNLITI